MILKVNIIWLKIMVYCNFIVIIRIIVRVKVKVKKFGNGVRKGLF